jgi:SAM-dependent methyltransferase
VTGVTQKHWFGPSSKKSKGAGHPVMFGFNEAEDFGRFPDGGGYPLRFLKRAYALLGVTDPDAVLHICSGSMMRGVRVDVRRSVAPSVVADGRSLPFRDESFQWAMIDPPYSQDYATNLYGTGERYPSPASLLVEVARVLKPGGRVGFLHFQVPMFRKPLELRCVMGVTQGPGYAIRAFSVLNRDVETMPLAVVA